MAVAFFLITFTVLIVIHAAPAVRVKARHGSFPKRPRSR